MKNQLMLRIVIALALSAGFLAWVPTTLAAGEGRLIVKRSPNLGANIIVDMMIDGKRAGSLTYGRTLEMTLSAGPHVLSVLPTPRPVYKSPWQMNLNVESGKTYRFIVQSGPGHLVLAK